MNDRRTLRSAALAATLLTIGLAEIPDADAARCPTIPRELSWKSAHLFEEKFRFYQLTPLNRRRVQLIRTLNEIRDEYHKVPPPPFLKLFYFNRAMERPDTVDAMFARVYERLGPEQLTDRVCTEALGGHCGWAWGINPAHNRYDMRRFVEATAPHLKCQAEGLTMIGYYSDPAVNRDTSNDAWVNLRLDPGYLVTILDLTRDHLPYLEALQADGARYLREHFDVSADDGDQTLMYFHWPTGFKTSTLHMHLKANYLMSTPEYLRSYTIDDVIAAVQTPDGVAGMIADRILHVGGLVLPEESENLEILLAAHIGPKVTIPNPFGEIPKIFKSVAGRRPYAAFQVTHPDEARDNSVRVGVLSYADLVTPDLRYANRAGQQVPFLSPAELGRLNMTGFHGNVSEFLGCLFPFFDGATNHLCIQVANPDAINLSATPPVLPAFTLGEIQDGRPGR